MVMKFQEHDFSPVIYPPVVAVDGIELNIDSNSRVGAIWFVDVVPAFSRFRSSWEDERDLFTAKVIKKKASLSQSATATNEANTVMLNRIDALLSMGTFGGRFMYRSDKAKSLFGVGPEGIIVMERGRVTNDGNPDCVVLKVGKQGEITSLVYGDIVEESIVSKWAFKFPQ